MGGRTSLRSLCLLLGYLCGVKNRSEKTWTILIEIPMFEQHFYQNHDNEYEDIRQTQLIHLCPVLRSWNQITCSTSLNHITILYGYYRFEFTFNSRRKVAIRLKECSVSLPCLNQLISKINWKFVPFHQNYELSKEKV